MPQCGNGLHRKSLSDDARRYRKPRPPESSCTLSTSAVSLSSHKSRRTPRRCSSSSAIPAIYEYENAPPASIEWLRARFTKLEARQSPDGSQQWLNWVIRLPTSELIGYVQATVHADGHAAIAYELCSQYWGRGLARPGGSSDDRRSRRDLPRSKALCSATSRQPALIALSRAAGVCSRFARGDCTIRSGAGRDAHASGRRLGMRSAPRHRSAGLATLDTG